MDDDPERPAGPDGDGRLDVEIALGDPAPILTDHPLRRPAARRGGRVARLHPVTQPGCAVDDSLWKRLSGQARPARCVAPPGDRQSLPADGAGGTR